MKKQNYLKLFLAPIYLLALIGCSFAKQSANNNGNEEEPQDDIEDITPIDDTPSIVNSENYLAFWNPSTSLSINIEMSQEAANFINSYQSNHDDSTYFDYYVPCTFNLTMNGVNYSFEEVGIRQKGNMSRRDMLVDNNLSLDRLVHFKLSFKETFDGDEYDNIEPLKQFAKTWDVSSERTERKNRTLFDMEKIDIKWNRNDDQTKSKQSYALKLFRENGVLAGHDTLADTTLRISGKSPITTTYEVLECIDSVFVKRHFNKDHADGDLYKCTYTNKGPANFSSSYTVGNQIGVEKNTTNYHPAYDLKTNKKKNTTHTGLLNLFSIINSTVDADTFKTNIEEVLDIKRFIKYEAIAYLLGNFDDMRNNANNYYLYIASKSNMAYIIPYDFDRCLGAGCEGRKDYMTDFSPESTKMQCSGDWQSINLYWRTVCTTSGKPKQVEEYRALYQKYIEDLLNNKIISNESFNSFVDSFPVSYRGNKNGSGEDNISFASYLSKKINSIKDSNSKGLINYNITVD